MRNATLRSIAALRARTSDEKARAEMRSMMITTFLSPGQRKVLQYLSTLSKPLPGRELADHFKWSHQYASSLLKELHDICLLEREQHIDARGKWYSYTVKRE